jgi:CheY-like chemotaxis protein
MRVTSSAILLVDPDARARVQVSEQLQPLGYPILHADGSASALEALANARVKVVVTELYLPSGAHECLIAALRGDQSFGKTRIAAHTHRSLGADRDWALSAGADAYLIKPTRAARLRYVVGRLATNSSTPGVTAATETPPILRRDSLDEALKELEAGGLVDMSSIVFGRAWWEQLSRGEQTTFRKRAKVAHISLRSDSMLTSHFVEVRGSARSERLSSERPESPYRR